MHFGKLGPYWMRVLETNVDAQGVEVWYETSATKLLMEDGAVVGVSLQRGGEQIDVYASGGVILTCGGFEFNEQMRRSFMEIPTIYPIGSPGNTGDGIRMALQAGAGLWHPWHVHGSYGFKVPDFPVAFRNHLGGVRRGQRKVAWILLDQQGRRFMNEVPVAPQDTGSRPFNHLDSERGTFDRIPAWLVFDEAARMLGPVGKPLASVSEHYYAWSADNSEEIRRGWILQAETVEALAEKTGIPLDNLRDSLARWQQAVDTGIDVDFERPAGTFAAVAQPPFYAIQAWPILTNTQGGPPHDENHRVVSAFGEPVPGLYAAGELGSVFGYIYLLGGNLAECLIGGRVAGRHAAQRAASQTP
jgi:succinate dehydrogenase/fumarate reductase flavoprotein subunit